MTFNLIYRRVAILMALGLIATACVSNGDTSDTAGDSPDVAEASPDVAPSRTVLEVANIAEPSSLNPISELHGGVAQITSFMLMSLLTIDDEYDFYSSILESWDLSDDARSVTLTVRPDLQWSDGTPVTSADVVMTLNQFLDPNISPRAGAIGGVASVSAPDDSSVVVEFEELGIGWLPSIAAQEGFVVLPAHVLGEVPHEDLLDHEYFKSFPVTNGPYKFVEWVSGQHVEFVRSDDWSLGEAGFERAFLKYVAADVARAGLETGEAQFSWIDLGEADSVGSLDGIEVVSTPGVMFNGLQLMHHGPLLDRRVRQAMVYAIDREGICEAVLGGLCEVPVTNIPQLAPDWAIPTNDVIEYRYDPDRARELLNEAGWDPSTELVFLDTSPPGTFAATAHEIAQGNMADVGINWTTVNVDFPTFDERLQNEPESFHGYSTLGGNFTLDPQANRELTACDAGSNFSLYCNDELDKLWETGRSEVDPNTQAPIYHDAFRILNEDVQRILLFARHEASAHDARLKGATPHPVWAGAYRNVGEWYWED